MKNGEIGSHRGSCHFHFGGPTLLTRGLRGANGEGSQPRRDLHPLSQPQHLSAAARQLPPPSCPAQAKRGSASGSLEEGLFHLTYRDTPWTISGNHEIGREGETSAAQHHDLQVK